MIEMEVKVAEKTFKAHFQHAASDLVLDLCTEFRACEEAKETLGEMVRALLHADHDILAGRIRDIAEGLKDSADVAILDQALKLLAAKGGLDGVGNLIANCNREEHKLIQRQCRLAVASFAQHCTEWGLAPQLNKPTVEALFLEEPGAALVWFFAFLRENGIDPASLGNSFRGSELNSESQSSPQPQTASPASTGSGNTGKTANTSESEPATLKT